jgi:hypothetical protein|tara:strand:- start:1226 stop:1882 length:657 start_codon:yes stop_codon:yes gene_type:complete
MKLITEVYDQDIQLVTEAKEGGGKNYFIEGVFMQGDVKNRNGRIYPMGTLMKEVDRYNKEYVKENRAYGELGHPQGPTINLERVSHMIKELYQDGSNVIGKAKIMSETPMGNIVKNLMDEGAKLGVSSRGMGTLRQKNGANEVQSDFQLATAADIVADPSAPNAFVEGVMEGVEWIQNVNGSWVSQYIEETQEEIRNASKSELQEAKFRAFTNFLKQL